jgi:hypothetical protein
MVKTGKQQTLNEVVEDLISQKKAILTRSSRTVF